MIEIQPNWHPIFVHFTIALVSVSALLYLISYLFKQLKFADELLITARWCLYLGALFAIVTVIAGFFAYYTVAHDTASHETMIIHRNWAIATLILILSLALWSISTYKKHKPTRVTFIIVSLLTLGLLMTTAWYGGKLVYHHGIGVMSLPKAEPHQHSNKQNHTTDAKIQHQGETIKKRIQKKHQLHDSKPHKH